MRTAPTHEGDGIDVSHDKKLSTPNVLVGLVLAAIVAAALAFLAFPALGPGSGDAAEVVIHGPDGYERTLSLAVDGRAEVATELGTNVIEVKDGAAYMHDADCPNKDCMRQRAISEPGQQLICLPHRLWVEVVPAGGATGEMDVSAALPADGGEDANPADIVAR